MSRAPIALFAYNRLPHLQRTVAALQNNLTATEADLFIFSDGASTNEAEAQVKAVREYSKTIRGFKSVSIITRHVNYGLGKNIIDGVSEMLLQFDKVIVVEDDLVTSPHFLNYMNEALEIYEDEERVISIHGYLYPVKQKLPESFFIRGADCLGWATWKRAWKFFESDGQKLLDAIQLSGEVDVFNYMGCYPYLGMLKDQIEGKNNSWAIRWYASAFTNNMYTLFPGRSLVYHAGGDGSGTNTGYDSLLDVQLSDTPIQLKKIEVAQNETAYASFCEFHRRLSNPNFIYRIRRRLKKILHQ